MFEFDYCVCDLCPLIETEYCIDCGKMDMKMVFDSDFSDDDHPAYFPEKIPS